MNLSKIARSSSVSIIYKIQKRNSEGIITKAKLQSVNINSRGADMKIEVKRKFLFWYWTLKATNGHILAISETYYSYNNAMRAAETLGRAIKVRVVGR